MLVSTLALLLVQTLTHLSVIILFPAAQVLTGCASPKKKTDARKKDKNSPRANSPTSKDKPDMEKEIQKVNKSVIANQSKDPELRNMKHPFHKVDKPS